MPIVPEGGARDLRETAVGVTQCRCGFIRPVLAANVDASSPLGRAAHLHRAFPLARSSIGQLGANGPEP